MTEASTTPAASSPMDVSHIEDPEVRRVLRVMQTEFCSRISKMQLELDAMLEVLIDKHVTSIGEFRREISRLGQNSAKTDRLHEALCAPQVHPPVMATIKPPQ